MTHQLAVQAFIDVIAFVVAVVTTYCSARFIVGSIRATITYADADIADTEAAACIARGDQQGMREWYARSDAALARAGEALECMPFKDLAMRAVVAIVRRRSR